MFTKVCYLVTTWNKLRVAFGVDPLYRDLNLWTFEIYHNRINPSISQRLNALVKSQRQSQILLKLSALSINLRSDQIDKSSIFAKLNSLEITNRTKQNWTNENTFCMNKKTRYLNSIRVIANLYQSHWNLSSIKFVQNVLPIVCDGALWKKFHFNIISYKCGYWRINDGV